MGHGDGNDEFWQEGARHAHHEWWGASLHLIVLALLVALLVIGVVWLVRRLAPYPPVGASLPAVLPPPGAIVQDPAVAMLRMRYAQGEVSREEFQRGLEDLTGSAAPWPGAGSSGDDAAPTEG